MSLKKKWKLKKLLLILDNDTLKDSWIKVNQQALFHSGTTISIAAHFYIQLISN